jgi:L-alanine-DL-glutamate epimerase-like enolase superfamily enzyme
MKISHIEAWPVSMPLSEPYTLAYETVNAVTNVFLRVETGIGITGMGCAAPDAKITGETDQSVLRIMNDVVCPSLTQVYH